VSICLALLVMFAPPMKPVLNMRRLAKVPFGPSGDRIVCCDSDHDSMPELIFHTGSTRSWDPLRIEFWEHQGWNSFRLVYADTGAYPEPIGITPGNGFPYSAGDVDGDGLTDLLCRGDEWSTPDSFYWIVMTLESPDSFSYPCSLSWHERWNVDWYAGVCPLPADEDSQSAFVCGGRIWGNVGNNQNEVKWTGSLGGWNFALRDFDRDGRSDIGTGWWGAEVWECTGDYQYERVWRDTFRPATELRISKGTQRLFPWQIRCPDAGPEKLL
jgi:hypothetical protein